MSAVHASCYTLSPEKESGGGEMNCLKSSPCGSSSQEVASEIMNDILNNAFEVIMAKNLQLPPKIEKISPNVVGDILENILSPPLDAGVSKENYLPDETALLDDEIKKIIKEMKCPPEQNIISTKGVGDQLSDNSEVASSKILTEPVKRNTLERKNRLTNLVKNSKQMFAKLVCNEHESEVRMTKSEEIHEKLLKVIDLEGDERLGEAGSNSATGIVQMPPESALEMVDLESKMVDDDQMELEEVLEADNISTQTEKKSGSPNRKKWHLGARIWKYMKRNKDCKKE